MLGSDSAVPAELGEAFRKGAERKKRETLATSEVSRNDVSDRCQMRLKRVADFIRVEIPGDRMHVAEVYLEGNCLDANPAQVAITNQVNQSRLVRDVLEVVTEQPFVATVRRRGNAKDAGSSKYPSTR